MENQPPIEKLPKWAQEHIRVIERQRDSARDALRNFKDSQTESPIHYELHPCTGEKPGPSFIKHFIQSNAVKFNYAGVNLDVSIWDNQISISWSGNDGLRGVAMVPYGYNQVKLISKSNLK